MLLIIRYGNTMTLLMDSPVCVKGGSYVERFRMESPVGELGITLINGILSQIEFVDEPSTNLSEKSERSEAANQVVQWLQAYFAGRLPQVSELLINLSMLPGTSFQKSCWQGLLNIPVGKTWSYQRLAHFIDRPKAVRAVGQANRNNPLPIVIPCHRVIRSDGELGGYMGSQGLEIKKWLLNHESKFS